MRLATYVTSTFFSILTVIGAMFKIMHWPGANFWLLLGLTGTIFIVIPLTAVHLYKSRKK